MLSQNSARSGCALLPLASATQPTTFGPWQGLASWPMLDRYRSDASSRGRFSACFWAAETAGAAPSAHNRPAPRHQSRPEIVQRGIMEAASLELGRIHAAYGSTTGPHLMRGAVKPML